MFLRIPQKTGMWGLGALWATCDDPKPLYINEADLSEDHLKTITTDIELGRIFEVDNNDQRVEREKRKPIQHQAPIVVDDNTGVSDVPPVLVAKAREFIKQGVVSIRKNLDELDNTQLLLAAITIEEKNKNRKTVLSMLRGKLRKTDDVADRHIPRRANMYEGLVEEEEGEKLVMDVGDLELTETVEEVIYSSQENTAVLAAKEEQGEFIRDVGGKIS